MDDEEFEKEVIRIIKKRETIKAIKQQMNAILIMIGMLIGTGISWVIVIITLN